MVCFSDHITGHVPYALVYYLRHSGHDPLRLRTIQTLALQALHKVMGVKVKVIPRTCGAETPV
jgi:hypothetical protein